MSTAVRALIDKLYLTMRRTRITWRLLGVSFALLAAGLVAILGQWIIMQQQLSYLHHLETERLPADQLVQEAALEIASSQVMLVKYVVGQEPDPESIHNHISDAKRALTQAEHITTDEERRRQTKALFGQVDRYSDSVEKLRYAKLTEDKDRIAYLSEETQRLGDGLRAAARDVVQRSVEQAQADVQRAVRTFQRDSLIGSTIFLLTFVVLAIAAYLVSRSVIRPIQEIQQAVQRMGRGEWEQPLPDAARAADELGQLAAAFNQMANQLQASYADLGQRVAERTADLQRRAVQLQTAAEVSRDATVVLEPQELMARVVTLISERFEFYHAGIFLLDETREWAVLQAASSAGGRRMLARGHRLKAGEIGIVGYVAGTGEPRIALDVGADAVFFDNPDLPETRSEIALPLHSRGEIIGALDVQSTEAAAFTDEDVAVLQTLADQVGIAIDNARLYQQAQESLEAEHRAYGEYGRAAWLEMIQRDRIIGYRYGPGGVQVDPQAWTPAMGEALRAGKAVQLTTEPTSLAIPVQVRGQTIGIVDISKPEDAATWTEEEIALFDTLTEQLGVALESARLHQDTQRHATREQLIGEITARMRETLDVDTVLQAAVREIGEALGIAEVEVRMRSGKAPQA